MSIIINDVRILDGNGGIIEKGHIEFDETGILNISEEPLTGKTVIEGTGKTLIPGLIDTHVHLGMLGLDNNISDAESGAITVVQLQTALKYGITTVRNLGTQNNNDIHVKKLIESGYFTAPRVLASGIGISITGGHGWQINQECDTPEESLRAARKQIRSNADVIKMFATGGMGTKGSIPNAPQLTEEQMRVVCEEAERVSLITAAHCTGLEGAQNAIRAGVRSIEHAQLDEKTTKMMRDNGTFYCPTIITRYNILHTTDPRFQWIRKKAKPEDLEKKEKAIRLCKQYGVKICASTDSTGEGLTTIGRSLLDEIELYVRYGLNNMEALETATKNAAELCKIDSQTGTLEVGKCGDMILLDENPLDNISALRTTRMVFRNGNIVYKNDSDSVKYP